MQHISLQSSKVRANTIGLTLQRLHGGSHLLHQCGFVLCLGAPTKVLLEIVVVEIFIWIEFGSIGTVIFSPSQMASATSASVVRPERKARKTTAI
jgi:hypothetical protein